MKKVGFRRSMTNDSRLISIADGPPVYLLVYVDDILVVGDGATFQDVKRYLSRTFRTTDLEACTHFIGMKVERRLGGIFLSQRPFSEKIVELAGTANAKPTDSPLPLSHPLYEKSKVWTIKDNAVISLPTDMKSRLRHSIRSSKTLP